MFRFNPKICSLLCFSVVAALLPFVLAGWIWDIDFLRSGFLPGATMKVNTALGLGALALAGFFDLAPMPTSTSKRGLRFCALFVMLLALASAGEEILHWQLGIDDLFLHDTTSVGTRWSPGRPSPVTLFNFILLAAFLLLRDLRSNSLRKVAPALALLSWILSFQSLVSHLEATNARYGSAVYGQMAVHTALAFGLLATGFLLTRPQEGIMRVVSGHSRSSQLGRVLLLFAILVPPSIAWLQMRGESLGLWTAEYGAIFRIVSQVIFFAWVALSTAEALQVAEKKEEVIQEQLKKAVRLRDEFLSIASHELRTPLTSMKLQAQITERSLRPLDHAISPERVEKLIRHTNQSIARLERLVNDMFDISKIDRGRLDLTKEATELRALVVEVLDRMQLRLGEAGILASVAADEAVWIEADRFRLDQVFTNLLANVVRYAPGAELKIQIVDAGSHVRLRFDDTGPGIASEDRERIFRQFERLDSISAGSGFGLGLHIAKSIVEAHGGSIEAGEAESHGARFTILLPKAMPPAA